MKKYISIFTVALFSLLASHSVAQVTIGAQQVPNPSAVLDLQSNGTRGLLLPCVALTDTLVASPLAEHVPGMLVYNTTSSADGQVVRGVYYDDGRRWWLATAGTPAGGTDYIDFRGAVYTTTATAYTVPDDAYAVMTMAPGAVTITMPVLTAADKGRTIYIMNNNTTGTSNIFDSSIIGVGTNQNPGRGSVFIWFGDKWVSFSK